MIHRIIKENVAGKLVVNCFQNTNFSDDSQAKEMDALGVISCELLSEY